MICRILIITNPEQKRKINTLKEPRLHILKASLRINNNGRALGVRQNVFEIYLVYNKFKVYGVTISD